MCRNDATTELSTSVPLWERQLKGWSLLFSRNVLLPESRSLTSQRPLCVKDNKEAKAEIVCVVVFLLCAR